MNPSIWRRRPAVWVVLFLIAGILIEDAAPSYIVLSCTALVAGTGLLFLAARLVPGFPRRAFWILPLALLGCVLASLRRVQMEADVLHPRYRGEQIALWGRMETEPCRRGLGTEMIMRTDSMGRGNTKIPVRRRVLVQVTKQSNWEDRESLQIGDIVGVLGVLEPLPGARNPGDFDYGRFLALNGIQGLVAVYDSGGMRLLSRASEHSFRDLVGLAQKRIYNLFDRYNGTEESSFLKGVVFGYRGDLSAEVKQSFMDTGTIHILAVSGSNVAVVALIFFSLVAFLRVPHRVATALTLIGLLWYMVITGTGPSVVRATIMAGALLIGTVLGRKGDVYNSLTVAALVMLLWDPLIFYDVGFQLSFAAVISILYLYPRLAACIKAIPASVTRHNWIVATLKLFAVSAAAQLGTLPFSVFYFGRVSLIALLANLVVVPMSGLNTLLGFATIGASLVSDGGASCYAALNDVLVTLLLRFVLWTSKLPLAYWETPGYGLLAAVGYYAVLVALFNLREPRMIVRMAVATLVALNLSVYSSLVQHSTGCLTVTVLDVGQGDAILIELPNRKRLLVDSGPRSPTFDAGRRIVEPWLRRNGIQSLEAMIVTHQHDDHTGGASYLLQKLNVSRLLLPDSMGVMKVGGALLSQARLNNVPVDLVRAGDCLQFDPSTRIFVLNPPGESLSDDPNDRSIVLKVVFGSSALLLVGDASRVVERRLMSIVDDFLASDVLKIGHHGASTSTTDEFLRRVGPSLGAISVGRMNKFGHPSASTITRLQNHSIAVMRTDLDGALVFQSRGTKFELIRWRKAGSFRE
jgi:competence protein ComEC